MMVEQRVHDGDGGLMVPEYVGGSAPAMKCRKCMRFIPREGTRLVMRAPVPSVRDLNPNLWSETRLE